MITDTRGELGAPADWGARSKTATWRDPVNTVNGWTGLSGLELLRTARRGPALPDAADCAPAQPAPSQRRAEGRGVRMRSRRVGLQPLGPIYGGLVCPLADTVAGCAVQTTLEPAIGYMSIDISVNYLRPVILRSGTLIATGRLIKPGRRVMMAEGDVHNQEGHLVATAKSNCVILASSLSAPATGPASGPASRPAVPQRRQRPELTARCV